MMYACRRVSRVVGCWETTKLMRSVQAEMKGADVVVFDPSSQS